MISWNFSVLIGVALVFLIIFFWNYLAGRDENQLRFNFKNKIEPKKIVEGLKGFL
jgi:hypothetical protein